MGRSTRQFLYLMLLFVFLMVIVQLTRNPQMEFKYQDIFIALGSIGAIVSAIVTVYRWIWLPHKTREIEIINEILSPTHRKLETIKHTVETFDSVNIEYLDEEIASVDTPAELRQRLKEIRTHMEDYVGWLYETNSLVAYHIKSKVAQYEELVKDWAVFGIGHLHDVLISCAKIPIYEENLTPNYVIEYLLNLHGRKLQKTIKFSTGEVKLIKLRDLLESDEMHRIINSIKDLEKSRFIKMLKDVRTTLLTEINDTSERLQSKIESR